MATMNTVANPGVIRCPHCKLNQFLRETCRRCRGVMVTPPKQPIAVAVPDAEPECYSFGRRLREVRLFRGMTQSVLAKRLGTSRPWISGAECGAYAPFTQSAMRLANALGVPIEALIEPDECVAWAHIAVRKMRKEMREGLLAWLEARAVKGERDGVEDSAVST